MSQERESESYLKKASLPSNEKNCSLKIHQKNICSSKKIQKSENQKLKKFAMSWNNAKQVNWKRIGKNEKKQVADTIIPKASPEILKWKECGGEYSMWKI